MPPCGTACCIGGAACILSKKAKGSIKRIKNLQWTWDEVRFTAKTHLGLTNDQADRLFYFSNMTLNQRTHWPEYYEQAYRAAKTPRDRAMVGVARIEHFIASNGTL